MRVLLRYVCSSNYCLHEFDMAYHHHVVRKRNKRLIALTMMDSLDDLYNNETEALRQYRRQYTYVKFNYPADNWLDKLLYALPIRGLLQHNADHNNDDVPLFEDI